MMRQIGKQILTMLALAMLGWALPAAVAQGDGLVTTIVTDPLTGVAIEGYDAVSYFIESEPHAGKPEFEYDWQGVPWYFESDANRQVFMRSPEIYAPQYGGHCVMSLSRGYLSDGNARLYLVDGLKLYFFYSTDNREAFLLSRPAALKAAAANWVELSKQLSGPPAEQPASDALSSAASGDASVAPQDTDGNVGTTDSSEIPNG
jgi:YHS domain-containing protein